LHDAHIRSLDHDPLQRTAEMKCTLGFPREIPDSPIEAAFLFEQVTHLLLLASNAWPGPGPDQSDGIGTDEWHRKMREFQDKGFTTTESWRFLMEEIRDSERYVYSARWARSGTGQCLEITGSPYSLLIRGESLVVRTNQGISSIDELSSIGKRNWDAWHRRSASRTAK
jgi:hypothetical protein